MIWILKFCFIVFHIIILSFWPNNSIFLLLLFQTLIIYWFSFQLCNLVVLLYILQDIFLFFLWSDTFLEYFDRFFVAKYFTFPLLTFFNYSVISIKHFMIRIFFTSWQYFIHHDFILFNFFLPNIFFLLTQFSNSNYLHICHVSSFKLFKSFFRTYYNFNFLIN